MRIGLTETLGQGNTNTQSIGYLMNWLGLYRGGWRRGLAAYRPRPTYPKYAYKLLAGSLSSCILQSQPNYLNQSRRL